MKRRDFFAAAGLAMLATTVQAEETRRQFVEIRSYSVKDLEKRQQFTDIVDKAFVPALNRQGLKPIGVFVPVDAAQKFGLNVFIVIPHKTLDTFVAENGLLLNDGRYRNDAAPLFETTSKNPVYGDCNVVLLKNFETVPVLEAPNLGPERVFQLRCYRSFNIERNAAKIRMFEKGGELPLFKELGYHPIFFGETLAGRKAPNLTYMVGFSSEKARTDAWKAFVSHPKWQTIKTNPEFADTATEIDNVTLKPSPGSQI